MLTANVNGHGHSDHQMACVPDAEMRSKMGTICRHWNSTIAIAPIATVSGRCRTRTMEYAPDAELMFGMDVWRNPRQRTRWKLISRWYPRVVGNPEPDSEKEGSDVSVDVEEIVRDYWHQDSWLRDEAVEAHTKRIASLISALRQFDEIWSTEADEWVAKFGDAPMTREKMRVLMPSAETMESAQKPAYNKKLIKLMKVVQETLETYPLLLAECDYSKQFRDTSPHTETINGLWQRFCAIAEQLNAEMGIEISLIIPEYVARMYTWLGARFETIVNQQNKGDIFGRICQAAMFIDTKAHWMCPMLLHQFR